MRQFYSILILSFLFMNALRAQQTKALAEISDFGNNPGNLKMFIHKPLLRGNDKTPLVVVLHGCSENAKGVSELTGWNKLADINHFVVLYPQQKFGNNPNLCFNWFLKHDIEKGQGENESIFRMIAYALANYSIDSSRIYITGLSAGAAMSVVMTATHPELFQSAAIFAGGAYKIATNEMEGLRALSGKKYIPQTLLVNNVHQQNPGYADKYPSLIIYQGLNDPVVDSRNATLLVSQWAGIHHTDTIPDQTERVYMGIGDISRFEFHDSLGTPRVILYEVKNLGHRVMVKPGEADDEGGRTGLFGVNKGYHSTYQVARDFGVLEAE